MCTDLDFSLLYILILGIYSKFARKNSFLALGVSIHREKRKSHWFRNQNWVVNPEEEGEITGTGRLELNKGGGGVDTVTSYCSKDSG